MRFAGKTHVALKLREAGFDHIQRHAGSDAASLVSAEQSSLTSARDIVVDSSNLTKDERMMWISAAQQACSSLSILTVVCGMTPIGDDVRSRFPWGTLLWPKLAVVPSDWPRVSTR